MIFVFLLVSFGQANAVSEGCHAPLIGGENCFKMNNETKEKITECGSLNPSAVCQQGFASAVIGMPPHDEMFLWFVELMSRKCCGPCVNRTYDIQYKDTDHFHEQISTPNFTAADFTYPILGPPKRAQRHGQTFFPLLMAPEGVYVRKADKTRTINTLMKACLNLWPLLTICVLMAFISGFFAWIMDTWRNKEEFPRPFLAGLAEGFWWSFVSMTTVGYGDKAPIGWHTRFFAMFWILIGITICSMFTASLTSAITSLDDKPTMEDKNIGVFKGRLYDSLFVLSEGGRVKWGEVEEIMKWVGDGTIDGLFIDRYTMVHYIHNKSEAERAKFEHTFYTYKEEKLAYGILINHQEHVEYFQDFIEANRLTFRECTSLLTQKFLGKLEEKPGIFDVEGGIFFPALVGCGALLMLILIFGLAYEIVRRHKKIDLKKKSVVTIKDVECLLKAAQVKVTEMQKFQSL